jgi:hypothetical protein
MKTKIFIYSTLIGIISLNSCKRDASTPPLLRNSVAKKTLTTDEKLLQLKLEQSAKIIAEVIKDKNILAELNQQIGEKLSITKSEESLTFKELFSDPSDLKVASTNTNDPKVFTIDKSLTSKFKSKYLEIAENKSYEHPEKYKQLEVSSSMKTNAAMMIDDMVNMDGAELYFPYSDVFNFNTYDNYTITSNPIDNETENTGIIWNSDINEWENVIVNDDYAYKHPTLIVNINDDIIMDGGSPPLTPSLGGKQILIGEVMSKKQYGELFTGGPQLVFCIFKPGTLTAPFSVNNNSKEFKDGMSTVIVSLTRKNVRKEEWVGKNQIAYSNWIPEHTGIHIGLYEDDSNNWFPQSKITFEPKVTFDKTSISVGKIEFTGKGNDFIGQYSQDRQSFFALNRTNQYLGTRTDIKGTWRIYVMGSVYYTMPEINY